MDRDGICQSWAGSNGYCFSHQRAASVIHRPIAWTSPVSGQLASCTCSYPLVRTTDSQVVEAAFAEHLNDLEEAENAARAAQQRRAA